MAHILKLEVIVPVPLSKCSGKQQTLQEVRLLDQSCGTSVLELVLNLSLKKKKRKPKS